MTMLTLPRLCFVLLAVLLVACTVQEPPQVYQPAPPPPAPEPQPTAPSRADVARAMAIADMLFEARRAFDDNRLMLPSGNNAYARYREVLSVDPGNAVAEQGIRDILQRYVQLADTAMSLGQFDAAAGHLSRAASIDAGSTDLRLARERLAEARKTPTDFIALDAAAVSGRSAAAVSRLAEIAQRLRADERATFLITARNDAEGRWMYQTMREAVDGYRLRGNIALGERVGVQLQFPAP